MSWLHSQPHPPDDLRHEPCRRCCHHRYHHVGYAFACEVDGCRCASFVMTWRTRVRLDSRYKGHVGRDWREGW